MSRGHTLAAAFVALAVAASVAPIVAGGGLHHHSLTSQIVAQAHDPGWPVWREGWDSARYDDDWFSRRLYRSTFRPVSATFAHLAGGRLHAHPWIYFGLQSAAHLAATLLLFGVARRFARPAAAALAALVFGLHPAAAHVLAGGKFPEFALGGALGVASLAALLHARDALAGVSRRRWSALAAAAAAAAVLSEESFVALALIAVLWVAFLPGEPPGWDRRQAIRLAAPTAAAVLAAASAQVMHRLSEPRAYVFRHADGHGDIELADRLLRLIVDSYLQTRRLLVAFIPGEGPWVLEAAHFADLSTYGLPALASLAALAALFLAARRAGVPRRVLACAVAAPIALALAEPALTRVLFDLARWPSLRQVYFPAAFLAIFAALALGALERRGRAARAAGLAVCAAFVAWSAAAGAVATRDALALEREARVAHTAIIGELVGSLSPGARVYLFDHRGRTFLNAVWLQLALGDPALRFTRVTLGEDGAPAIITRLGPRTLEIRREGGLSFGWLRPPPPAAGIRERARAFLLSGGRINHRPLTEPRLDPGLCFDIAGMDGDAVLIAGAEDRTPTALRLELTRDLDDPRTALIAWAGGAPRRLRCPRDGAACAVDP